MKLLLKVIGINLLVFLIYTIIIEVLTKDDWEGFAYAIYYAFFIGIQLLVNAILTLIAAIKNRSNFNTYLVGVFLTLAIAGGLYLRLN